MSTVIVNAELIPIRRLSSLLPGNPTLQSIYRWMHGIGGVRLETTVIGGRRYVSKEQVQDFIGKRSQPGTHLRAESPTRKNRRRQKQIESARKFLEKEGL